MKETQFLSTLFLCSEFKLENIYSGVNFCGKNVWGNFYLREIIFADRWKNRKNLNQRPRSSRCSSVQCVHFGYLWLQQRKIKRVLNKVNFLNV